MTRTRIISPRVEPPKDTVLQWFHRDGATIIGIHNPDPADTVAWCLPAQLDGTTSGPVHSLEAVEMPSPRRPVLARIDGNWYSAYHDGTGWWFTQPMGAACGFPDAWRPLDEPGDAELLEAATELLRFLPYTTTSQPCADKIQALRALVEKRSGK